MSKAADKLSRIRSQIVGAQDESKELEEQINLVDGKLTKELAKATIDESKIATLESQREELVKRSTRLGARAKALEGTVGDAEEEADEAALKDAIARHPIAVQAVNNQLKAWLDRARGLEDLASLAGELVEARNDLGLVESELRYLTAKLGVERPELPSAKSLTAEETKPIIDNFHKALTTTRDPWARNKYDGLLQELTKQRKEAKEFVATSASKDW